MDRNWLGHICILGCYPSRWKIRFHKCSLWRCSALVSERAVVGGQTSHSHPVSSVTHFGSAPLMSPSVSFTVIPAHGVLRLFISLLCCSFAGHKSPPCFTLMLKHTGCAWKWAGLEYPSYRFMTCFANNRWLRLLQPLIPTMHCCWNLNVTPRFEFVVHSNN